MHGISIRTNFRQPLFLRIGNFRIHEL
jgi:hypothetical protein